MRRKDEETSDVVWVGDTMLGSRVRSRWQIHLLKRVVYHVICPVVNDTGN